MTDEQRQRAREGRKQADIHIPALIADTFGMSRSEARRLIALTARSAGHDPVMDGDETQAQAAVDAIRADPPATLAWSSQWTAHAEDELDGYTGMDEAAN